MTGTLYTPQKYHRAQRIQIAAKYSGYNLKVENFVAGKTDTEPSFLKKFPAQSCPVFESGDTCLFDASAIASFVGNDQLKGGSREPEVTQWVNWSDSVIAPATATWVYPCLGVTPFNKAETEKAKKTIDTVLKHMNTYLEHVTFLVGERITQADITVFCNMIPLFVHVLDASVLKSSPHVQRWFLTMANQPNVKSVVGAITLCTKQAQFDGKKYAELHPKADAGGAKKAKEPKKEAPKKAQAKKEAPKPDDDEEEAPKKEEKDPFASMEKGTFNMDEFKRTYSNNPESVSLPYFWEKFDPQNYSIWYGEYKFPEELRMPFMSCNLISGMFQRLDRMRKHAFGSMCLFYEDDKSSSISGVFVWRGQGLAFELSPDLQVDYESYTWKKLEPTAADTKTMITEYFSHAGSFGGKKFNQGKIFK